MKQPARIAAVSALIAALPVELVSYFVFPFPLDVGLSNDASWFAQFMGFQWVILHLPGLRLTSRCDPYFHHPRLDDFALLLSGYLDTAFVSFFLILGFILLRRVVRKPSSSHT